MGKFYRFFSSVQGPRLTILFLSFNKVQGTNYKQTKHKQTNSHSSASNEEESEKIEIYIW